MFLQRRPHGSNGESSDDEATNTAPQKSSRRRTAVDEHTEELHHMQATAALSNPEDRQFVDDFLQRVMELAQEKVGGQSKFSAMGLMQLAGYRIQAKVKRASFNKVTPFNLFLKENKTADNKSLPTPVRGAAEINHARPSFTGAYQKHMSGEYKLRKGFVILCGGGDLHAQVKAAERRIERKRDVLRKEVTTMILERLSKFSTVHCEPGSILMLLDAIHGGSNVDKIPRSNSEKFLADRKVKRAAPVTFGVTQRDIIEKLLSHQLDDLSETYDALENDELKLVPLSRR
jgi:hypothetical protein